MISNNAYNCKQDHAITKVPKDLPIQNNNTLYSALYHCTVGPERGSRGHRIYIFVLNFLQKYIPDGD